MAATLTINTAASRASVVGALACQRASYLRTLESQVVSCVPMTPPLAKPPKSGQKTMAPTAAVTSESPSTDTWLIEFTDSVLFPEGGGQPSDYGTISPLSPPSSEPIPIRYVQRQGLRCVYHSPTPLDPGTRVRQEIDHDRRWYHMQQHTGQHLLSAIMDRCENLKTVGWGMGQGDSLSYVDLPRKPSAEELQDIQRKCNEAIRDNLTITVTTPADAKSNKLPEDYDKDQGLVRVISIGDLDQNTCCGTHLAQTSHISLILLHSTETVNAKRSRLYFSAGDRAIQLASKSIATLQATALALSSPNNPEEILTSVKGKVAAVSDLKKQEKSLLAEIAKYEGDKVRSVLQSGKNAWVHRAKGGLDFLNLVILEIRDAIKISPGVVVLAGGEGQTGGPIIIVGQDELVGTFATKVKELLKDVKGGGRGGKWQGKVSKWKKGELEALKALVEQASACGSS
ncbi:threonyl and alanyl tRNA synthetase second additional domain-containing protein [Nemania sp. FL0916]|nr:threonyl and alanyl tRNA synthetase second additional domain-containing protein [Nemania sp. FL0916]